MPVQRLATIRSHGATSIHNPLRHLEIGLNNVSANPEGVNILQGQTLSLKLWVLSCQLQAANLLAMLHVKYMTLLGAECGTPVQVVTQIMYHI